MVDLRIGWWHLQYVCVCVLYGLRSSSVSYWVFREAFTKNCNKWREIEGNVGHCDNGCWWCSWNIKCIQLAKQINCKWKLSGSFSPKWCFVLGNGSIKLLDDWLRDILTMCTQYWIHTIYYIYCRFYGQNWRRNLICCIRIRRVTECPSNNTINKQLFVFR